jgi:hypothetical protein
MTFGAIHWMTLFVGIALGYFALPWVLSLVMGRGK